MSTEIHQQEGPQGPHYTPFQARPRHRLVLATATGDLLYHLGFAAEYRLVQFWRVIRNAAVMAGQVFLWLFGLLFGWIAVLFKGVWHDLTEPFRHLRRQRRILEKTGELPAVKGGLAGARARASLRFLSILLSFLLPVAATAALVLTVRNVVSMDYALKVEIDGQMIGYVADQTVVDAAKTLLLDRLKLAENQEAGDWQLNPTYTIARASTYTTAQQLVNEILRIGSKNPGEIMAATGLYMGGKLVAVTEDGARLRQYLDDYLAEKTAQADPNAYSVSYVSEITCDPSSEEVFFTDSVLDWDEMAEKLASNVSEAQYVVANGEESLAQIAAENNLSQAEILSRNPEFAEAGVEAVPEAGKTIKVENAQPLLQVKETFREWREEEIPFQTYEEEASDRAYGTRMPIQEGVNGWQEVLDEISYIDGEAQPSVRVETNVITPAVDEVILVGTNRESQVGLDEYMFPVPSSTWSSRGISSYHRGLDINAPTGEPIFACQAGTVVTAGWHYSYGYHVVIDHGNGMTTLYAHCSQLDVEAGQEVVQGQLIGRVGSTGNSSGPHCHLEFQLNGALRDPLNYITLPAGYRRGWG